MYEVPPSLSNSHPLTCPYCREQAVVWRQKLLSRTLLCRGCGRRLVNNGGNGSHVVLAVLGIICYVLLAEYFMSLLWPLVGSTIFAAILFAVFYLLSPLSAGEGAEQHEQD